MYKVQAYYDVWYIIDPKGDQYGAAYDSKAEAMSDCKSYNRP